MISIIKCILHSLWIFILLLNNYKWIVLLSYNHRLS